VGLALLPLTLTAALLQASPLVVTIAAALFLGERVRWRRWTAVLVGLMGILIILRPGMEGFRWAALLTIACVLLITLRDIATRVVPADIGTMQLTTWAYLTIVVAGVVLMALQGHSPVLPSEDLWGYLAGALLTGVVGYWAVTAAMRVGEASVVAPFRYSRLVFSVGLAMIFLGERPDQWTVIGSALVIGSGLYTLAREARLRARTSTAQDQPL
jgi:drug/metabolite transporter (DMT)-like permease